jgi:hypothetical protein
MAIHSDAANATRRERDRARPASGDRPNSAFRLSFNIVGQGTQRVTAKIVLAGAKQRRLNCRLYRKQRATPCDRRN